MVTMPVSVGISLKMVSTASFSGTVSPLSVKSALRPGRKRQETGAAAFPRDTRPWALSDSRAELSWSQVYQASVSASTRGMSSTRVISVVMASWSLTDIFSICLAKGA